MNFRKIDKTNYMDCILLQLDESQRFFVADNAQSLAEAAFEDGLHTLAVYHEDTMVGFILYDYDCELSAWSMSRFMIGKQFQSRGYGKRAALAFLEYLKTNHNAGKVYVSVSLENVVARKMYADLGFEPVQEIRYSFGGRLFREMQMRKCL